MTYLSVNSVSKTFGSFLALDRISLHVEKGEFICVVGASGSGKSTLLRIIAGLTPATSGSISLEGVDIKDPGSDRGMVFQTYTLFPWMTVLNNIAFGLKLKGIPKSERLEQAWYYLDIVGLNAFAQAYPKQLSGGMKQRVAIARALANQPKVLLMDEPFAALDAQIKEMLQQFLLTIWQRTGTTILMITHDVEEAVFLSQRIYVLSSSPGSVRKEVPVMLPISREYHLKRSLQFQQQKEMILDFLRQEAVKLTQQERSLV